MAETLVWADATQGTGGQLANFLDPGGYPGDTGGVANTAAVVGGLPGSGTVQVLASLTPGTDVANYYDYNYPTAVDPTIDPAFANAGELVTGGNYVGTATPANSGLLLTNLDNGGSTSGAGITETVSARFDFTTTDPANYTNGVSNLSFWIGDIDANSWQDLVEIVAYDVNGNPIPATSIVFSNVGANVITGIATGGVDGVGATDVATLTSGPADLLDQTDPDGAVQVNIAGPVGRVDIIYYNGSTGAQSIIISDLSFDSIPIVPPCFTTGTLILTENGEVPVEDLVEGDLVTTADHGPMPIRWIGKRTVKAEGRLAPICISKDTLGNRRDLLVSAEHRMVVSGTHVEALFAQDKFLAPAHALVDGDRIYRKTGGEVTYFHILFDQHEVVFAEGAPSESFYLDREMFHSLPKGAKSELIELFPELNSDIGKVAPALPELNAAEIRLLVN